MHCRHSGGRFLVEIAAMSLSFSASTPSNETPLHRSPVDVALVARTDAALTANHSSDSVSLVDLSTGKVRAELPCDANRGGRLLAGWRYAARQ